MTISFAVAAFVLALLDPIPFYLQNRTLPADAAIYEVRAPIVEDGELVLVSSTEINNGSMGLIWKAYLVGEHSIHRIHPVACFHPRGVYVGPYQDGPTQLLVYRRRDARHGDICRLFVADGQLTSTLVRSLDFVTSETETLAEYDALFPQQGTLKMHTPQEYLGVAAFRLLAKGDATQVTTSTASTATLAIDYTETKPESEYETPVPWN